MKSAITAFLGKRCSYLSRRSLNAKQFGYKAKRQPKQKVKVKARCLPFLWNLFIYLRLWRIDNTSDMAAALLIYARLLHVMHCPFLFGNCGLRKRSKKKTSHQSYIIMFCHYSWYFVPLYTFSRLPHFSPLANLLLRKMNGHSTRKWRTMKRIKRVIPHFGAIKYFLAEIRQSMRPLVRYCHQVPSVSACYRLTQPHR